MISAIEKGFSAIGFSGHGYTDYDLRYCMKNTDGYIAEIKNLKEKYKKEVVFIDERLTSASAKEEIFGRGGFRALAKDKGAIDSLSAVTILEQYFSEHA